MFFKKKEVSYAVYVVLAFAALATAIAILIGTIKALKVAKAYKEVANMDTIEYEKQAAKSEFGEQVADDKIAP